MSASSIHCKELFRKYINPVFIETGSYLGDGIQQAIDAGFKKIYSIELSRNFYTHCCDRFEKNEIVHCICGDSGEKLFEVMEEQNEQITFWLDGHYSGGDTAIGPENTPLLRELEAIKRHPIKTHTILIDDLRGWIRELRGFDTLDLMKKILEINPDYVFTLEDGFIPNDILVAKCLNR